MKIAKSRIYIGKVKKFKGYYEDEGFEIKIDRDIIENKQVFVKFNNFYVPSKEIKNFIRYLILTNYSKKPTHSTLPESIKDVLLLSPDIIKKGEFNSISYFTTLYADNLIPVYPNEKGNISLDELENLRLDYLYTTRLDDIIKQ